MLRHHKILEYSPLAKQNLTPHSFKPPENSSSYSDGLTARHLGSLLVDAAVRDSRNISVGDVDASVKSTRRARRRPRELQKLPVIFTLVPFSK